MKLHAKSIKGEITQEVVKAMLSFLYATHRHDLFYITVKYTAAPLYRGPIDCGNRYNMDILWRPFVPKK